MQSVASILRDHSLVKRADDSNRFFEIEMAPGADPQALLRRIIESGASVQRFEMIQPSLHQIFLQKVGAQGIDEGMTGHGYALGDHQARVPRARALEWFLLATFSGALFSAIISCRLGWRRGARRRRTSTPPPFRCDGQ